MVVKPMLQDQQPADQGAALLSRIDAALARGEAAAARLDDRQRQLRVAARSALDILDRLIDCDQEQADG